ncbi:MAG: PAS domain S-box protein [Desulfobacterales bacterium]|jgi:PAS domain S-box-containing protein
MKLSSAEPNCCLKNTRGFLDGKRRSNATHCAFRNKISYHKKPVGRGCQNAVALQNIEERYRALADATFESVFISENGICIEANQMATKMFGYDYDELIGVFGTDVIAPESKELVRHNMLSEYEEPYEALALRKDGTTFHAEIRGKMAEYKGKKVRVTVVHDIDAYKRAAAALQESEERFRTLVEYAPLGFSIMKPDRTFEYFNPKFTETFGYTLEDIPNKAVWFEKAYPDKNYRDGVRAIWEKDSHRKVEAGEVASRTFRVRCRDGRDKIIHFRNVALTGGKQILSYQDITSQVEAEEELRESEEKLRYLSSRLLTAHENERRRISFELHDVLGQDLAVLKIKLKLVERDLLEDQKALKEACESACQHLDQMMNNVRKLSHWLSPVILEDLGLSAALDLMIRDFAEQTHIDVTHEMANIDALLSHAKQIIVYRIFQEAFVNIRKHSQATHVKVSIIKKEADVYFSIEDNGKGFDEQEVKARNWPQKGLGLIAMEERARILGGPFERTSGKGNGTRITLTCPFDAGTEKTGEYRPKRGRLSPRSRP